MKGDLRCIEGRLFRHDPQYDDPDLETDIGQCPDCSGGGCGDDGEPVSGEVSELPKMALSIRQPWAWAIVRAGKDIENRNWPTRYRGPVCIHAAKGMTRGEYDDANSFIQGVLGPRDNDWLMRWLGVCAAPDRLERGGIIGIAEIVDCVSYSDSPWFFGHYGFVLRNAQPVDFIPVKGALGFFDWRERSQS